MTTQQTSSRERGVALVASLLFAITILSFSASVILSGFGLDRQRRSIVAAHMAQDAAESGVNLVVARISGPEGAVLRAGGATINGNLRGTTERAQRYEVRIERAGGDGTDNDLDGLIDETDEADMLELVSTGYADDLARTVRVTLLARYQEPEVASATYLADPMADLRLNGNSFVISGIDVDESGVPTGLAVPGIGVAGDPTNVKTQIKKQITNNVVGQGGEPSVYQVSALDLRELIEAGARAANVHLPSGSTVKPAKAGDWGTLDAPAILYGSGHIHISGGASGAGIMIVDGDLTITGGFEWRGLAIVRGELTFSGGGGGKRLMGALIVERDVSGSASYSGTELTINGTIDILFSKQIIGRVSPAFATFTIVNWREGPNPRRDALP
ncbi:MAG: type IV pilus modification PilV family protein [Planctomycetaceae bacterium]